MYKAIMFTLVAGIVISQLAVSAPPPPSNYQIVVAETPHSIETTKQLIVNCPSGKKATGAGWGVLDQFNTILDGTATYFAPSWDGSGWMVNAKNNSSHFSPKWKLNVWVMCS